MRPVVVLAALCVASLTAPSSARAQIDERSAEEVLLELTSKNGVGLMLDAEARQHLRTQRVTFSMARNTPVVAQIHALLRMTGVSFERLPERSDGSPSETLFVVHGKAATAAPIAPAAGPRVAVVDMKALFDAHPRKAALEAQVNAEREDVKRGLEDVHRHLHELKRRLEQEPDPAARGRLKEELEGAAKAVEARTQEAQRLLKQRVDAMTETLLGDVEAAVGALARREGLTVVLARRPDDEGRRGPPGVVWSAPELDVTAAAIEELRRATAGPSQGPPSQRGEY